MLLPEYISIAGIAAALGLLWALHRDMGALSGRLSRLEGLLEGLRDAVTARDRQ